MRMIKPNIKIRMIQIMLKLNDNDYDLIYDKDDMIKIMMI